MLKVDFLGDGKPGKIEHLPLQCWTSGIVLQMRTYSEWFSSKEKGGIHSSFEEHVLSLMCVRYLQHRKTDVVVFSFAI